MGVKRSDPVDDRRRTLMRQGAAQSNRYSIGGQLKKGNFKPRPITLPQTPWDKKSEGKPNGSR